jgi:hypothetical protein
VKRDQSSISGTAHRLIQLDTLTKFQRSGATLPGMKKIRLRRPIVIGATALAFAAAGGGAYAATQSSSNPQQAFLNDVAKRLHVSPPRLDAAVKGALLDRLNAAVRNGRLTQFQANVIKQRVERAGALPFPFMGRPGFRGPGVLLGPPGRFGGTSGPGGPLAGSASYLGLTQTQLLSDLRDGHSLAQIAKAKGKSEAGLGRAMTAAIRSRLEQAVAAKHLTKSQEQQLLSRLTSGLRDFITGTGLPRTPAGPPPLAGPPGSPWPHHHQGSVPTPGF